MRRIAGVVLALGTATASAGDGWTHDVACGTPDAVAAAAQPATLLIGGAEAGVPGEVEATSWWLDRAEGGDYLVMRIGGTGGQAAWMCAQFGHRLQSAAELSVDTRAAADDPDVVALVAHAELIFIAGGDQTAYHDRWRATALADALDAHLAVAPIAGTSAGMMALGGSLYAPAGPGVLSSEILDDPFHPFTADLRHGTFLAHPLLTGVILDTHLDRAHGPGAENRYGRLFGLLARAMVDTGNTAERAIGAEEGAFVAIDAGGRARVFGAGNGPAAWFLQPASAGPEIARPAAPLVWHRGGAAVKAYRIAGSPAGSGTFDLGDWLTAEGGQWHDWFTPGGAPGFNFVGGGCSGCGGAEPPQPELFADGFESAAALGSCDRCPARSASRMPATGPPTGR